LEEWYGDDGYNPNEDDGDLPDLCPDPDDDNEEELEEGNHVFYTVFAPAEEICAGSTVLQHLAEAFAQNSSPAGISVLEWTEDFSDVFDKESFDFLLERQMWDHAIELVPDSKPTNCKVYPISQLEQKKLDAFIVEGLSTSRICLSKSLMASLVFFMKKEDRGLWFVQDYRALSTMTVKNQYPLPLINNLIN
jgi:hypothetical protein